ncbi:class I SAM-dependent methyltransferase [Bosea spartocytisi]|nr:class I SAM-dependent methyltransferase [Bosea spartocytisi]MCT4472320.1 class I SAM-dependent methyltransferase [Bosea spartocytisi]
MMMNEAGYRKIERCRLSGSRNLVPVLNLGHQELTGVFPAKAGERVTNGPLELVWCPDSGLLQLAHSYDPGEMYGDNYGYRSGLNQSMVDHLTRKVRHLELSADLKPGDTVLDIGSNDCTTLKAYSTSGLKRIGIDPTGEKFRSFYPDDIKLVPDFFSAENFSKVSNERARLVSSIAMFYDLEDPVGFAQQIEQVLAPDGLWHFEQSYMPSMLRLCSYDTICHEHLEYYSLGAVQEIVRKAGLKIIDVQMNGVNGGSFAVTVAKAASSRAANQAVISWLLEQEERMGLATPRPYREFEERVFRHRADLVRLLDGLVADGKTVLGYGASTKGNVVLQFCGLTEKHIPAIAEVNPEKFGRFTPGTNIPIISEADARKMNPDYFLVLPWHFKDGILRREQKFLDQGGKMIFPFPEIEIV